jgi:hypothetical protein
MLNVISRPIRIITQQTAVVARYCPNDIRRHRLRISLLVQRRAWLSTINKPSERQSINNDKPGRLGNDGGARAVKEQDMET